MFQKGVWLTMFLLHVLFKYLDGDHAEAGTGRGVVCASIESITLCKEDHLRLFKGQTSIGRESIGLLSAYHDSSWFLAGQSSRIGAGKLSFRHRGRISCIHLFHDYVHTLDWLWHQT